MALKSDSAEAAELVAAECVTLAETKDHLNWELLGPSGQEDQGRAGQGAAGRFERGRGAGGRAPLPHDGLDPGAVDRVARSARRPSAARGAEGREDGDRRRPGQASPWRHDLSGDGSHRSGAGVGTTGMTPSEIDEGDSPASALRVDESTAEASGNVLLLPPSVERELNNNDESLGVLGHPFDRRTPFFFGLTAALGVAVAYVIAKGIADITQCSGHHRAGSVHRHRFEPDRRLPHRTGAGPRAHGADRHPGLPGGHRRLRPGRRAPDLARGPQPHQQLPPLQSEPGRREGLGREAGRQAAPRQLPEGEVQAQTAGGRRGPRGRQGDPLARGGHRQPGGPHHLLPDRPARGHQSVAVAHPPEPAGAGGPADRGGLRTGRRLHAREPADVGHLGRRHLRLAPHLRGALRPPAGPVGGPLRPHPHGGLDHRRDHRVAGGADQGPAGRRGHGRLLRRLPLPGGLSGQSPGDEAHGEGDARSRPSSPPSSVAPCSAWSAPWWPSRWPPPSTCFSKRWPSPARTSARRGPRPPWRCRRRGGVRRGPGPGGPGRRARRGCRGRPPRPAGRRCLLGSGADGPRRGRR